MNPIFTLSRTLLAMMVVAAMFSFTSQADAQLNIGDQTVYPVHATGGEFLTQTAAFNDAVAVWQPLQSYAMANWPGPFEVIISASSTETGPYIFNVRKVWDEQQQDLVDAFTCTIQGGFTTEFMPLPPLPKGGPGQ